MTLICELLLAPCVKTVCTGRYIHKYHLIKINLTAETHLVQASVPL